MGQLILNLTKGWAREYQGSIQHCKHRVQRKPVISVIFGAVYGIAPEPFFVQQTVFNSIKLSLES